MGAWLTGSEGGSKGLGVMANGFECVWSGNGWDRVGEDEMSGKEGESKGLGEVGAGRSGADEGLGFEAGNKIVAGRVDVIGCRC